MRIILVGILVATIHIGQSRASESDPRTWISLDKVLSVVTDGDESQFAYLLGRCSGLYFGVAKVMETRADAGSLQRDYTEVATNLMLQYIGALEMLGQYPQDSAAAQKRLTAYQGTAVDFANAYISTMESNWMTSGSYISGDSFMENEVEFCKMFSEAVLQ
jgi:hypothetical protein